MKCNIGKKQIETSVICVLVALLRSISITVRQLKIFFFFSQFQLTLSFFKLSVFSSIVFLFCQKDENCFNLVQAHLRELENLGEERMKCAFVSKVYLQKEKFFESPVIRTPAVIE